jgi:hypothetical protein
MNGPSWLQKEGRVPETIHTFLTDSGGGITMAANYLATAGSFKETAAAGETIQVNRLIFYYEMTGVWAMSKFGSLAALTNGITVQVVRTNETKQVLTNGLPIKNNGQFAAHCYDWLFINVGSGDNAASVRWTLGKSGAPLVLYPGDYIEVIPNDDLSTMTLFTCKIDGVLVAGDTRDVAV